MEEQLAREEEDDDHSYLKDLLATPERSAEDPALSGRDRHHHSQEASYNDDFEA